MKIAVYQCSDEVTLKFCEIQNGYYPQYPNHKLIGTLGTDFVIERPKKLVTKEAVELHLTSALIMDGSGASYPVFCVPSNAKNVRCAYEVEE